MKQLNTWMKREDGFTLIEMSLVLFIISALLLLFVPNIANRQEGANKTSDEAIVTVLQSQADMYTMDRKVAPATFKDMETKNYLTPKQSEKAEKDFNLEAGIVTRKTAAPD
ncbi:competence type IV pilus major pilin ComGC [Alkalibacterium sp. f15]|uniref:competence type IV pilus major pilin ComGC n=1 Tax=Alkalibacterium sp. f15 TaxID=3414029 RepID=UPI003BF887DD